MYKVVIIDDENIIVEGLQRVVDWEAHGCTVAGVGYDAKSGAEMIRKVSPDIVFTDIHMPGDNGLTMLAGLKSEFPHMQVTVLTGYRDFEYAQTAIRLGVSRYLLKPSKMDELTEAILCMTDALDKLPQEVSEESVEESSDPTAPSFLARQAQSYIMENYQKHLTLQDVADHCYVSQWYLSRLLNKYLGQPFYDILNKVRVEEAKKLLEQPALRISEIAEQVGYADTAHFSRVFKRIEGVSAGDWRNRNCGKSE